ncbi:sn-glycerol-1-phosphate dehydrogenase [Eubacteriales bacterium OttesenSCG-928-N13]|nr:sn-glycerol-1-phosphate dehydrogenase [Eubacteriales bacterium OttesenSCG-928-N13]
MPSFSDLSIQQLLGEGFDCACGHHHGAELVSFHSGAGAIKMLPQALHEIGCKKPFVVCDQHTYRAAGEQAVQILTDAGIEHVLFILPQDEVEPNEFSMGSIAMGFEPGLDVVLAIGSGVINDCCKEFAHAASLPSAVVATAPSMDGYASGSSSMLVNSVKSTLYNSCPAAIILDSDILCQAPMRMLWSGLGDMIAKYVSICEWRIAQLVVDEYYCPEIAALMRRSLKRCVENADRLKDRDPEVILAVTEGLVLSGIAMAFAGTSRPASGMEHYFSHMWEMMALERGEKSDFHGIQVGVGTVITLKLYDWIKQQQPDAERARAHMAAFNERDWEAQVHRIFGQTTPQILAIEQKEHKNDPAKHEVRLEKIIAHWQDILQIIEEELPPTEQIVSLMQQLGAPMTNADLGISVQDTCDAFVGARDIRNKYLGVSMLWDLGLIDEARDVVKQIAQGE